MTKRTKQPPAYVPPPRDIPLPSNEYQPSKADMEAETDMPGMSDDELRRTFFRPFNFVRDGSG